MNAVLWKIGTDFKRKRGEKAGGISRLFIFKELETEKEFKMNLPLDWAGSQNWLNYAQEGNVFFGLQVQGLHPKNIDFYKGFTRVEVKEKNRGSVKSNY